MNTDTVIEMIGYFGSALVLVSMLMTSVVKLRLINLTGSVIFAVYALIIRSYPTALMNIALAGINIFYLVRIFKEQKIYDAIKTDIKDGYFSYLLGRYRDDILFCFPEAAPEKERADVVYLVCCDSDPACLFLGKEKAAGELEVVLDYATPVYRDASVGRFLYKKLAEEGYRSLAFTQKAEGHIAFLEKVGYERRGEQGYVLDLGRYGGRKET
ncbi:MAG: YgjV family protein [Lachnospiraceae bacterium]|nr:YgjV family protein [Lachnospiraceae bacterium]